MHKKFSEDRTCRSEDMIADRETHTHTDRQTDKNNNCMSNLVPDYVENCALQA